MCPVNLISNHGVPLRGRGGGEEGVEAPGVEQRALPGVPLRVGLRDASHHQTSGDVLGLLLRGEGGVIDLSNFGPGDPPTGVFIEDRLGDRKSTRLNSSHVASSYAVFCLKKKV